MLSTQALYHLVNSCLLSGVPVMNSMLEVCFKDLSLLTRQVNLLMLLDLLEELEILSLLETN